MNKKEPYNKDNWFKINAILTIEQYKRLRLYAFENNLSMSHIVREALDKYFSEIQGQEGKR